jgi:hypothetical protein
MPDLQVNDDVLADSERRLGKLKSEFENLEHQKDDLHGVWGSGEITDAMGEFFDNWSHYRKKLLSSIEDVGGMVTTTRKTFANTDNKLAQSTADHSSAARKAGH